MKQPVPVWIQAALGLMVGILAVTGYSLLTRPHSFSGTVLENPKAAFDFNLAGPGDQRVRLSDSNGKMRLIFFGYTSCPDVCPTTLADLTRVLKLLGNSAEKVQVLFISVDPEKDTSKRLSGYISNFDTRILGLTGTLAEIQETANNYNSYFEKIPFGDQGGYTVDHTAMIFLIDLSGNLNMIFSYGTKPADMAADIAYLLR